MAAADISFRGSNCRRQQNGKKAVEAKIATWKLWENPEDQSGEGQGSIEHLKRSALYSSKSKQRWLKRPPTPRMYIYIYYGYIPHTHAYIYIFGLPVYGCTRLGTLRLSLQPAAPAPRNVASTSYRRHRSRRTQLKNLGCLKGGTTGTTKECLPKADFTHTSRRFNHALNWRWFYLCSSDALIDALIGNIARA